MTRLPYPTNFEQGQRKLFGLAMIGSGLFAGAVGLGLVGFVGVLAFKFPDHRELLIYGILGALGAYFLMQSIVMISMAVGGPVGRFKVSATKEGASLEATGDGEPVVSTTTTTTVSTPEMSGDPTE